MAGAGMPMHHLAGNMAYADPAGYEEMPGVIKDRLSKPRSIFAPGQRIKMNVVPMFLNVFVPWGAFILCNGILSFSVRYSSPILAWSLVGSALVFWVVTAFAAFGNRFFNPDPTWLTYSSLALLVMILAGIVLGEQNYFMFSKHYYTIRDMKTIGGVDAGSTPGQNVMDAGIINFKQGNHFDDMKSWHFVKGHVYCVSPIVSNSSAAPNSQTYDFWAVGKDCCSATASDFRCGAWGAAHAKQGIRLIDEQDMVNYRLAVQQTEAIYNLNAPNPIFVKWSSNPEAEVNSWTQQVYKNYLVQVAFAFVSSLFFMSMASCQFAWIGRAPSAWDTEFLHDPTWYEGGYRTNVDFAPKAYGI